MTEAIPASVACRAIGAILLQRAETLDGRQSGDRRRHTSPSAPSKASGNRERSGLLRSRAVTILRFAEVFRGKSLPAEALGWLTALAQGHSEAVEGLGDWLEDQNRVEDARYVDQTNAERVDDLVRTVLGGRP